MKRSCAALVLLVALLGPAPAALAHPGEDHLGTYSESGAHLTHFNPTEFLFPAFGPSEAVATSNTAEVTHLKNVGGNTGGHIVFQGKRLYMGNYGTGFSVYDIADPANPLKIATWQPGPKDLQDPGARADAVPDVWAVGGRHIVAFGGTSRHASTTRTEFVDATDPTNLKLLWQFVGKADGESHNSDVIDERGLWIPSGSSPNGGLRIYDMRPLLQNPPGAPVNLFRGNPNDLWRDSPYRNGRPVDEAYSHTHDVQAYVDYRVLLPRSQWKDDGDRDRRKDPTYAKRDILLMAEGGNYTAGNDVGSIYVIDITNPRKPVALNQWRNDQEKTGFAPIRYYHEIQFVDGLNDVMAVTDEDMHSGCQAGGMILIKASDRLTGPIDALSQWFNGHGTPAAVCSMHVMSSKDGFLIDGSYNAGLQVVDVRHPRQPVDAASVILPGANTWGAYVRGSYIYTGDFGGRGLDVFRLNLPN